MSSTLYRWTADAILLLHIAFVAFVVAGLALVWLGYFCRWHWVRDGRFRLAHVLAIGVVVAETAGGLMCPLTTWEHDLRVAAGENAYTETFMEHWVGRWLFHPWSATTFDALYFGFFLLVVLTFWFVPPTWRVGQGR